MSILELKKMMANFLSNRFNLNLLHIVLYIVIGIALYNSMDWTRILMISSLIIVTNVISHVKGTANGMVYRELMLHHDLQANEILEKIREEAERAKNDDLPN